MGDAGDAGDARRPRGIARRRAAAQAGLYAGMTMDFPTAIVTGPRAAYMFLLYISQVVATVLLGLWGIWSEGGTQELRAAFDDTTAEPLSP